MRESLKYYQIVCAPKNQSLLAVTEASLIPAEPDIPLLFSCSDCSVSTQTCPSLKAISPDRFAQLAAKKETLLDSTEATLLPIIFISRPRNDQIVVRK